MNQTTIEQAQTEIEVIRALLYRLEGHLEQIQQEVYQAAKTAEGFPPDVVLLRRGISLGDDYIPLHVDLGAMGDYLDFHLDISVDIEAGECERLGIDTGDLSILTKLRRIEEALNVVTRSEGLRLFEETQQ